MDMPSETRSSARGVMLPRNALGKALVSAFLCQNDGWSQSQCVYSNEDYRVPKQ